MDQLIKQVEAILFSVGDRISIEELSKLTKEKDLALLKKTLRTLRDRYIEADSPLTLHEEGQNWKMNVREEHLSTVRKIVKKTELPKTLLETLSVIAWKAPVKQSIVIHVRTNKAYDHLDMLEKMGYITRKKFGRTKLINITQKFYDYFEINKKGGLGKIFKRVTDRAKIKYGEHFEERFDEDPEDEKADINPKIEIIDEKTGTSEIMPDEDSNPEIEIIDEPADDESSDDINPKIEIIEDEPQVELVDDTQKLDDLEVFDEEPKTEIIEDEFIVGGKKLTPENIEKLKKAQELLNQEK